MGATLTTTRDDGNLLIAFTAFFIPFVATRFWRICCFFLHRLHSTAEPKGAIHHQRQVLLRNASSMESALVTLFFLVKNWQARKNANVRPLLPIVGLAIIIIAGFTVAGGFSSRISSGVNDEVLIHGDNCGIVAGLGLIYVDKVDDLSQYTSRTFTDAADYAQQCYSNDSSGILSCDRFVVKGLQTATTETNRSCPFQGDICQTNSTNIRLDTGYIDSHEQLGLNAPPNQRFEYRYVLECAPLKTEGHVNYVDLGNITWAQYRYGDHLTGSANNQTSLNFTYEVEDLSYQYSSEYKGQARGDFLLSNFPYFVENGEAVTSSSSFIPIPELIRNDGDVTIIFLSGNGVYFWDPVDDDWYRATVKAKNLTSTQSNGKRQAYRPVDAASPLGCVEQWQWCKPTSKDGRRCGSLASRLDALSDASPLFNISGDVWQLSERPYSNSSTASRFIWSALIGSTGQNTVNWAVKELKTSGLASRSSSYNGIQYALPKNQWHLDVQGWWNTILARTQAEMVNVAVGHTDSAMRNTSWLPNNHLFGLYFTYITGALIVIISYILEPVIGYLHSSFEYHQYKHLEWTTNETLQLHRLAHEGTGLGTWSGCTGATPTTLPEANLASLDIGDLTHPILARPDEVEEEVVEMIEGDLKHTGIAPGTAPDVILDITSGIAVDNIAEISEKPTEVDLTVKVGHDSSGTTMGHGSRNSLQSTLSAAHSLLGDHATNFEIQDSLGVSQVSPTEHGEEQSRR
ncbi:hypothetical protein G7054_g14048 [Neopestalotiopsis clavispora]|nr:hypothetical protein G7054_g14048 [Neopestalotiopsis clavispora]